MNFSDVCDIVQQVTKRPDKINSIRAKVNAAITFYCLDNNFSRDYAEQSVTIDATQYSQSFALSGLTRFRKFKFLKRGGSKCYLTKIADEEIVRACDLNDKYYIVGDNVNINMVALAATLDVGYYSYPPILSGDQLNFWLLDVAPYMIIDRACSEIFREIGEEKSANLLRASAAEQYIAARKDLGISTQ